MGANITTRIESLMFLADVRSALNHYILKTAIVLDRTLRAQGTTAQLNAQKELKLHSKRDTGGDDIEGHKEGITAIWEADRISVAGLQR